MTLNGARDDAAEARLLEDQEARRRIVEELETTMLVEAGAGSGKTTSLVDRMVALVARGVPVDRVAAVTFTRKAAAELRERFQLKLESIVRDESSDTADAKLYDRALHDLDRAFLGTIHSFCGRLLRERPLEVQLDPNFREVIEEDWEELRNGFWRRWIERTKRANDPGLAALYSVGIEPRDLHDGFELVMRYPDVEFPATESSAPDIAPCRRALEALLATATKRMPREEPEDGWDDLMRLVRRLQLNSRLHDWSDISAFTAAIEQISAASCKPVQKRWSDTKEGRAGAKQLGEDFTALMRGEIADVLRCWREHRYPVVLRYLRRAAMAFETERHETGQLGFEDLLLLAARLLREHPAVRDELGRRYTHLLVDEFQDTDPIQAEVCFLLASDSNQGNDWRTVTPRPGSLFVVGDPKQSIYRFRRADIQTYELVKRRIETCGAVLSLTRNFRSVKAIELLVNEHFESRFPAESNAVQAQFTPMHTARAEGDAAGVRHYAVRPAADNKDSIFEADSAIVASWIAERIARGERAAGDFLILTATREPIEYYARALGERNIPVSTSGAALPQEHELEELLVILRAMADPENPVAVAASLEGLFFGLSPADLFDGRQAGLRFSLTHPPAESDLPMRAALRTLHEWWKVSQRRSADVLLERILEDTGLLFHAASQPMGDARAGALLHLVEVLRAASVLGASGISDAMRRIESALGAEAADAPLRPGRLDAVRVMNLHRAKGLEGEVVILAAPADRTIHEPVVHVHRGEDGRPTGGMLIRLGRRKDATIVAHPPGWAEMQAAESAFEAAERERLLYVAVTRARRELVVSRCERIQKIGPVPDDSAWSPLAETLESRGTPLELVAEPAAGRRTAGRTTQEITRAASEAESRLAAAGVPSGRVVTVTESVKQEREFRRVYDLPSGGSGAAWGRAVHRTLEAMGRGRDGAVLTAFIDAVARDEGLSDEARSTLHRVPSEIGLSPAWRNLLRHGRLQVELAVMQRSVQDDFEVLTEGVIDAAASNGDGWLLVDWKTDTVDEARWRERESGYHRQVERYGAMLSRLTGRPAETAVERVLLTSSDSGRKMPASPQESD